MDQWQTSPSVLNIRNSLPCDIHVIVSVNCFKKKLKILFNLAFDFL